MKVKVDINKLRELVSEDVLKELVESEEKTNRLVTKYGMRITFDDLKDPKFLQSLLSHSVILMYNNTVYALPISTEDRDLKLYYRKIK